MRPSDPLPIDEVLLGDPALGHPALGDPQSVAALLRDTGGPQLGAGEARYVEHDPGASWLVWHRFETAVGIRDLVVSVGRRSWPDGAAGAGGATGQMRPVDLELAGTGGVVRGVTYAWYPADAGLPLLALGASELGLVEPVERLAWVPQRRAVLADATSVAKLDADPSRVRVAVDVLQALRPVLHATARVPEVWSERADGAGFVQERLVGTAPGRADARGLAGRAGALLAVLHDVDVAVGAAEVTGHDQAAAWRPVLRLVRHGAPELAPRLDALDARLSGCVPELPAVLCHGDFNVGQLVVLGRGELGLVDTETVCRAPAAFDLAAYATNVLSGREGDLEAALDLVEPLVGAYGSRPEGLDWMLAATAARRLDRPIRRAKRRWRARVHRMLADVETLAARLDHR